MPDPMWGILLIYYHFTWSVSFAGVFNCPHYMDKETYIPGILVTLYIEFVAVVKGVELTQIQFC